MNPRLCERKIEKKRKNVETKKREGVLCPALCAARPGACRASYAGFPRRLHNAKLNK